MRLPNSSIDDRALSTQGENTRFHSSSVLSFLNTVPHPIGAPLLDQKRFVALQLIASLTSFNGTPTSEFNDKLISPSFGGNGTPTSEYAHSHTLGNVWLLGKDPSLLQLQQILELAHALLLATATTTRARPSPARRYYIWRRHSPSKSREYHRHIFTKSCSLLVQKLEPTIVVEGLSLISIYSLRRNIPARPTT